jgi:murein DD-endopeptidase MepM/ murein hydrolase activator NlpD
MARRRARRGRRNSGFGGFLTILIILALIGAGVFAYLSPQFEKVPPKINLDKNIYASNKKPIKIKVSDNVAIKSAKVMLSDGKNEVPIFAQDFLLPKKEQEIDVNLPKDILKNGNRALKLIVEARDSSLWGFFKGNKAVAVSKLLVDSTPPKINIVASSTTITKGGTALVIVKVDDASLDKVYIDVGNKKTFTPIKYRKNGYFASLFVWPFNQDNFSPKIIAIDKAGNIASYPIRINKRFRKYKVSKIRASDKFINGKITQLASEDSDYSHITDKLEKFRAVNELMRKKNEDLIHRLSKKVTPINGSWRIKPFHPLKRAKKVADFGDKRYYYYGSPDNIISTSYHLGFDLASIKEDNIYTSNDGIVVFNNYNGIYGHMPMIDHGFGLYTIYGHCSSVLVEKGERVHAGQIIAKTGVTGLALGDHTHFGILVQGVEVLPLDWMDKNWLQKSIFDIFAKADRIIGYNGK